MSSADATANKKRSLLDDEGSVVKEARVVRGLESMHGEYDRKKIDKNFQIGDIVCVSVYPGRDHWQQVGEIVEVHRDHYRYRHIQFRTTQRDWSTDTRMCGMGHIRRGDWNEEQTCLFQSKTLEQVEKEKEDRTREIVREEIANFNARLKEEKSALARPETKERLAEYLSENQD